MGSSLVGLYQNRPGFPIRGCGNAWRSALSHKSTATKPCSSRPDSRNSLRQIYGLVNSEVRQVLLPYLPRRARACYTDLLLTIIPATSIRTRSLLLLFSLPSSMLPPPIDDLSASLGSGARALRLRSATLPHRTSRVPVI
jgi:hypothetical protein